MVWGTGNAIRSRLVPASGTKLPETQTIVSASNVANPSVAANTEDGGFLVMWDQEWIEGNPNVYGQRMTTISTATGSRITIANHRSTAEQDPDVAFGTGQAAGNYLVGWEQSDPAGKEVDIDIYPVGASLFQSPLLADFSGAPTSGKAPLRA